MVSIVESNIEIHQSSGRLCLPMFGDLQFNLAVRIS